jgi:predicted deacetylase
MGAWMDADGCYRTDPWFDDFGKIPQSMHDEFAAAARQHGKVVEINLGAVVLNNDYPLAMRRQYCEYLAGLRAAGVSLSIASDHHAQHSHYCGDPGADPGEAGRQRFSAAMALLEPVGLRESDFWRLPPHRA